MSNETVGSVRLLHGKREISLAWLLADFQDIEEDLIPGAFGAEVLDNDDSDYQDNPQNS